MDNSTVGNVSIIFSFVKVLMLLDFESLMVKGKKKEVGMHSTINSTDYGVNPFSCCPCRTDFFFRLVAIEL